MTLLEFSIETAESKDYHLLLSIFFFSRCIVSKNVRLTCLMMISSLAGDGFWPQIGLRVLKDNVWPRGIIKARANYTISWQKGKSKSAKPQNDVVNWTGSMTRWVTANRPDMWHILAVPARTDNHNKDVNRTSWFVVLRALISTLEALSYLPS